MPAVSIQYLDQWIPVNYVIQNVNYYKSYILYNVIILFMILTADPVTFTQSPTGANGPQSNTGI